MLEVDGSLPSIARIQTLGAVACSPIAQHLNFAVDSQSLGFETQQVVLNDQYILFTVRDIHQ